MNVLTKYRRRKFLISQVNDLFILPFCHLTCFSHPYLVLPCTHRKRNQSRRYSRLQDNILPFLLRACVYLKGAAERGGTNRPLLWWLSLSTWLTATWPPAPLPHQHFVHTQSQVFFVIYFLVFSLLVSLFLLFLLSEFFVTFFSF